MIETLRPVVLEAEECFLTPIIEDDLPYLKNWRNEQMAVLRQTRILTDEDQKIWFAKIQNDPRQILFAIASKADVKFIGYCGLTNIDRLNKRAEISFLLFTGVQQEEYCKLFLQVLGMLKHLAFQQMKLHKIFTETYAFRKFHIQVLEKFGFECTGVLRDHIWETGSFHDSLIHSVLNAENDHAQD